MNKLGVILAVLMACLVFEAKSLAAEADYVREWCDGQMEVRLQDGTKADCVTDTHAIEFDYSYKWAEAVGQSLHYANMTGKKAGIHLIMKGRSAHKHLNRLKGVVGEYALPIDVQTVVY